MTVKSFAESNSLGVDKVLNLCQKLGIDVENESDSLSEDDQMLLEYELEELEKANSGVAASGEGGSGSSSKKKKSDSDSDGSDFHIDNDTFAAAYKCLVDAVNMLENGLGDLSGLNQNGIDLIGNPYAGDYNYNLSEINSLSSGLQNRMTDTIIMLSRMHYKNANYFKDTLGDLLKEGKDELNDYLRSDEYKVSQKNEKELNDLFKEMKKENSKLTKDEFNEIINGWYKSLGDGTFNMTSYATGMTNYDVHKAKDAAMTLGIYGLTMVQDTIGKLGSYNSFNLGASKFIGSVASEYGLGNKSDISGLANLASECGLDGDLNIQNFINNLDDQNKKIDDEEEKILDSYAKENCFDNFDELNSFYEEKTGKSYFEFFETFNSNNESMTEYYDKLYSIDTNEDAALKNLIENYLTIENKDLSLIDYAKMTTAGYSYSSDGKKKAFCSLLEMIPTYADNNSVEEISFYDILSGSSKFQDLCNVTENATVESYIGDVVEIYDSLNFNVNSEIEKLNLEYKDVLLLNSELQITKFEIDTSLRDYQRRTQLINSSDFLDNKNVRDVDTIKSNVDNILDRSVINYVNVSLSDSGAKKTGNINLSDDELYQLAYASANGIGDIKIVENGIQMSDGTVLNCYGLSDKLRDDLGALGAQISVMTSNDPTLLDGGFKKITQDDYMLFSNDEVNSVIKSFKDRTENQVVNLVNVNNKRTVTATEEESMYLLNAYYNNIGDFELDGKNQLYYTNSDGVKIYIKSPDNILSTTLLTNSLNSNNVTSLLTNSVDWQKFTTDYNYLDEFNYIYNTSSVEDRITNIKGFFDDNASALDQRWVDLKTEIDKDFANRNPVVASINSVGLGPSEGLSTVIYAFEHLNDTTPVYRSQTYSTGDTYRSQVSSNIRESGVDGAGVSAFFYDVGMSMADNVFNAAVFGPNAVGLGLALSSFDNSYNDALDRGVNSNTAFWYSFASATLEAATEQFAFDHLREVTGLSSVDDVVGLKKVFFLDEQVDDMAENIMRKIAGNQLNPEDAYVFAKKIYSIFSQAGSEGMEEYVSSVGGRIIDDVFNGSLSAENIAYNNYIASGMSEEAAYAAVKRDNLTSDIISFFSGAVSGGGMATGGSVVSSFTPSGQYLNTLYRSEYTGDYAPTINSLLNMSNIPLTSKVLSAKLTINGLYSDGKIDLESKQKLETIVQDYHNDNYKGEFSGEINEIAKQDEFYQISLYTEMKSRLESKGVKTDKLSFEKMQKKYQDDYNTVVESLKDMEIKISTDSILYGITKSNDVDLENFKLENREMFDSELKRITEDYSDGKEKISHLIYSIVNNKIFGSDSEKVALKLINKMNNKSEITSDQTILSSLVSGIGMVGITQENLLVYMNHQDLTINDIVDDDSLSFLSEQDRNARLAQILKNYLDQMVNTAKEQNNLSSEQQLRQEHFSKNNENKDDKKSIRKDSTSDEKVAMIGKGKNDGSGNDSDLKVNNNSEVVVEENKTDGNEKTSTIETSSNESTKKGQNCIRSLFSPKNSDNSIKTNRLRNKLIKIVVSTYKNIDSRLARDLLRRIDMSKSEGGTGGICGYYEVAKVIFRIFDGKEKLFKQKFGFSMYLNGDFNFEQLIVDLFVNNNNEKYVNELLGGTDVNYKALCDAVTDGRCFNIERICDYLKTKKIDISPGQFKEHQIYNSSNTDFKKMSSDDAKKVAIEIVSNVREQIKSGNQITISAMGIHSGKLEAASGKVVSNVTTLQLINVKTGESRSFSEGHVMSVRGIDSSGRLVVYTFNDLYAINLVDVLSKGNVFSINSLEIGQNILDGKSVVDQKVSVEIGPEGSLIIDDDAVMSNGEFRDSESLRGRIGLQYFGGNSNYRINSSSEYMSSISRDQLHSNLNSIVFNIINGKKRNVDTYAILVDINSTHKSVPNQQNYENFTNRFRSEGYIRNIQPGGHFYHFWSKEFNQDDVSQRLYINAEYETTFNFLELFANKCEQIGIPFYFKTAFFDYKSIFRPYIAEKTSLTRSESAVIYASNEYIVQYTNICREIKNEHPEFKFYNPPVAAASIDGWLGYGAEPNHDICVQKGVSKSFNSVRARILDLSISKGIKNFINAYANQKFYADKTGNDLLIDSLYGYLVSNYKIDNKESLYSFLISNREYCLNFLKQDVNSLTFMGHKIYANNVRMYMFENYLVNINAVYKFISDSIREISVEYGVDPDNFAINLSEQRRMQLLNNMLNDTPNDIKIITDIKYIMAAHDKKYGSGDALSRLKMFIDPSSRNYRNYGIISGNLGARNLLMKYNPQDITRYLSRFDSGRMSNNNQGLSGRIGLQYFANKGKSSNLELDIVGSLTSDDAVMSNGEEDFADGFIELDDRYVVHNILINDDSVSELFNSIKESRYYNYQYKKEEVLFGLVKAFKRDSSYAEVFSERYDVSREFYNMYVANRNNLNSDQEILEFVKNYVQENTKPGSKTDLSQFSLFDIISPRNSNLYGVRQLRHSLIDKFVSKVDGVTQKFMYRILSNIESGIVLDSKYTMITGYIFNKYDGNSKEFERIFGFPMYIDGGFNKTMLVADIYSYMLSSQYEGKSVSEIFSILMDSRGKLDVVDELISNYLIDRGIIDKKQEFIYKSIFDSKTDFGDISNVNYIISNIISKISDSLSNGRKVIFSLESTNSLYVNSLSLKNIDDKSVIKVYSGEGLTIIGVLDNNKLVVENSGGKYYIDLKDILIFGKKFNINEISFDFVATEDRNIKRLKSNSQVIVNNKKLTIDEFYEQFNNKDFNLGGFIIKGYEILDFASDERYLDRLSKPSSNGIVYGSYSAKDMIFSLVKLFQELDKNGISANKLYPHIGKIYNEYKASARKGLLNTDNDIRMFASNYAERMGYLEGLKNNSQSKVVGMKEFGEEGNIDFQIADDFYDENIELTKEATEKLDNFMRNNGSFEDAFRVLKNAVRSKDFDSIPDALKSHLSGLTYNQMKTYLKNKMSQIISDDISNFDLHSFFYKKNNVADSRAYVVITDNNMIMIPSNHGSISYTLGDIFEYLDRDFDSSKYMNEAMMRRNSGYIVIELQNKFIGGRNIIYSPDVISGNQYRMLQEFNQQIKELTSKDNLASLGFNLRGNNGSSLELVNVNNIDGILSRLLEDKRVNKSDVKEIRDEMAKQQEIVEEISDENKTKVEEYDDAVMSNGEEDIDEFEDDQFRFISDDRFFSSLFDGNGKYGIDQGLFRDLRKRNHPTYIEMKNMLINKYGFSQRDAIKVMKNLDVIGAGNYAAQANIIVSYFKNMPNKFQELFGFPLYKYDSNGRMYINDAEILLDLYSWYNIYSSESELFIIDKDGRTIFNKDAIKSRFGKIIMYKQRGGDNTNHNVFNEYLKSKSKDLSCVISEVSIDSLISNKKDYEVDGMTLVLGCASSGNKPIIFEEIDTGIKYLSNGEHWTKITGVVEEGFIVSSKGKRCLVKFEDLRSNYHNIYFTKFNLENNNVSTVEEVMSNLFNIEDIRNNKKVVNMMDISKFRDNYSVDELNNILLSNRYSLSSKKAVSLALYLSSLNLDFYNIDCTYNSLVIKLFDKSLSSIDRLMTFELLRTISNEYSSFGSIQYLFDQQFIGVSESEILDLKTRNIQFDLNEFYSSNEGTVNNGATVFFTGNQVVNLLNDDHGEAGHSETQYHIFSSIYGISLENDFASSFIYKNLESMIRVVLVSERGVSGCYIKFPSKISRKQFEMFKAYADKYGDTLSDISKGISDSGFRGLIYYSDGSYYSSESHNISDAVTFAETLIDERYEMLDDKNIVGYTLDDLRGVDVSDDEEFNEEYDDPYDVVMSNGEEDVNGYELEDGESLHDRIGIQYFGVKDGNATNGSNSMNSIFRLMNKFFNKNKTNSNNNNNMLSLDEVDKDFNAQIIIDSKYGYQLNKSAFGEWFRSRINSGFFGREQIELMLNNINSFGYISESSGKYFSHLFNNSDYDIYVKTIYSSDLDSIMTEGIRCLGTSTSGYGMSPKSIQNVKLSNTVTSIDGMYDLFSVLKSAFGVSQGLNPINGTLIIKVPKGIDINEMLYFSNISNTYCIKPEFIDSFCEVDENGVVSDPIFNDKNGNIYVDKNDSKYDIKIIDDIKYIIESHDKKYSPGDALYRLKLFIDPNSKNYANYDIISSNLGARDLLMKYTPQDIARYLSRFDSERLSNNNQGLSGRIGLQFFASNGASDNSSLTSDDAVMSNGEKIILNLFNIEDIRNNNNVVDIDNIKQFESMSVDELNSILMSKRYNLSQKKAVSLVLYLKTLNLSLKTDNIDFVYNSLIYKLSDKSLSSVDKLRVFELLRTISNEFSEFDSVDELLDYQFNIPSESEILDVKTRNSKFDLNEFYSSNEFGHDNGAVIRFTDNQVVSVLNGNNGRGAHGFANENIISAIFGINYVYQSKNFIDPFSLSSSFLSSNSRNMIDVRLVSEYGYSLYVVDFPDKISRKQFELFKAYADKYGDTLRRISEDLTANNKTNGYDGLIGFIDKHNNVEVSTHDINDLVKYAETLIDDDYRLLEDRNIVGYTLDDLRGVDVSDDIQIDEEYDDAVMSNGDEDIDDGFIELHDVETVGLLDSYVKKYRGGIASAISRLKLVNSSDSRLIPSNLRTLSSSTISSYVNHLLRSIIIDQNNRFNLDEFLSINTFDNNTRMFYVITPHQELMFSSKTDFGYEISFLDVMRSLYGESLDISTEAEALELAKNMGLVVLSIDFKYNENKDIYLPTTINSMQYKTLQKFNDELSKLLLEKGRDSLLFKYHMDKKLNISGNLRNAISIYSSKIDNNRLYVEDINLSNYNLDGIRSNIVSNIFEGNITKTNDVVSVNDESLTDDIIEELDDIVITHNKGFADAIKKLRSYVLFGSTDDFNSLIKSFSRETVKKYLLKVLRDVVVNVHNDFDLEEFYSYGMGEKTGYLVVTSKQVVMIPSEIMLNTRIHFEDICEILFENFDRSKYKDMTDLDIAKELGVVLVELHSNKSNVVYSPKTINAYQYKMLSKFNDQIKTIISNNLKFNERNIEFTLVGDNTKLFNQLDNLLEKIVIEDNEGSVSNSEVNLDLVDITNVEVNERISKVREILDSVFGRVNFELSDSVKNIIEYLKHRDSNNKLYNLFRVGYFEKVGDFKVASLMNNNSGFFLGGIVVDIYDGDLTKKIEDFFDKGMTCDQIIKELSFFEKVKFKKFLRNTEMGRYLKKLTSEELFALKLWFSSDISAINKISDDVRNIDIVGDKVVKLSDSRYILNNKYMYLSDVIANLESAIEKFGGLKENMVLTNIVNIDSFMDVNGEYYEIFEQIQDKNDPFEVLAVLRSFVGVKFFDSSFVRLSNNVDIDNDKLPIEIEYIAPKGTPAVHLNGFLFNRNVVSQIVDVDVVPNGNNKFGNYKGDYRIVVRCVVDVDTTNSNTKVEENDKFDDAVMSNGEEDANILSEKMIEEASKLFDKSVSELTVRELEDYKRVVKTADKIFEFVPKGFFKDDIQRDEFLYGVSGDVATGSNYSAFDLRTKFLDAINNGSLVKVIDTFTKGELDSLKVAGFYKIIYAINQFVETNGIIVEDGVLPIKQIVAKDPAYFEGGKDLILSVLANNLKQAKDNRERITDVLTEIATLNNGTLRGLDKSLKSKDSASRKVYNSWLEALEDAGYTVESDNNVIEENGNIRLIGIKEFNKGQSFVITSDGTVMTADLKDYGVDKKGNVVNISFSDFIPKDLLRYTIISDTGNYMDTLLNTIRLLEENGYEIISSNLSWPGSFYKGVNLTLREKNTSQIFELQFHTETSFYAKNEGTHDFYEVKRNKLYNDGEKSSSIQRVADYAQILVESNVEVPNGAEKLGVISKFVKYVLKSGKNIDLTRMNEIINKVKEINSMYDSNTDAYKDAMKALINSVSIEGKFSFGEFLSEYLEVEGVTSFSVQNVSDVVVEEIDDSVVSNGEEDLELYDDSIFFE